MGCLDKGMEKSTQKLLIENLKRGKSQEQKRVIDFFLADEGCTAGCLSGMNGTKQMTMTEYQQAVANKLYGLNLKKRALAKIALDESEIEEIPPIVLSGYAFEDSFDGNDVWVKVEGTQAVASRFAASWIFFSDTQIYTYTYKFDMTSDDVWETTQDFFYQDITCFTTQQRVVEKIDTHLTGCIKKGISAEKNNYIVDTLKIIVPNTEFSFSMRNNETLEQSLQAAKAMLRERKFVK